MQITNSDYSELVNQIGSRIKPSVVKDSENKIQNTKKDKLAYQTDLSYKRSRIVSIFHELLLGLPSVDEHGKPSSLESSINMKLIEPSGKGKVLHAMNPLKSSEDSVLSIHDLDHGSSVTDPMPDHMSGSFAEFLVTTFHKALDGFLEKFVNEKESFDNTEMRKASYYTTAEMSPETLGPYFKYVPEMVKIYSNILEDYPTLSKSLLTLNHSMNAAFEEFSLNGDHGDGTGFCLTPEAFKELREIHDIALKELHELIKADETINNTDKEKLLEYTPDNYWDTIGNLNLGNNKKNKFEMPRRILGVAKNQFRAGLADINNSARNFAKRLSR